MHWCCLWHSITTQFNGLINFTYAIIVDDLACYDVFMQTVWKHTVHTFTVAYINAVQQVQQFHRGWKCGAHFSNKNLLLCRCAMALLHSRVFYNRTNPFCVAPGSQYRLHVQQGFNHHFEVYQGTSSANLEWTHYLIDDDEDDKSIILSILCKSGSKLEGPRAYQAEFWYLYSIWFHLHLNVWVLCEMVHIEHVFICSFMETYGIILLDVAFDCIL